jgi:hypothetical protein
MREALDSIIALRNNSICVDSTLLTNELWGNWRYKLGQKKFNDGTQGTTIGDLLDPFEFSLFRDLGYRYQYYVDRGKVYICSADSAKKRWITWWANLTEQGKPGELCGIPGYSDSVEVGVEHRGMLNSGCLQPRSIKY